MKQKSDLRIALDEIDKEIAHTQNSYIARRIGDRVYGMLKKREARKK